MRTLLAFFSFFLISASTLLSQNSFARYYGNQIQSLSSASRADDGGILMLGEGTHLGTPDQVLIKTDSSGKILWNRALANAANDEDVIRVVARPGGGSYSLTDIIVGNFVTGFLISHYDPQGQLVWQTPISNGNYEFYTQDIRVLSNGNILVIGNDMNLFRGHWYILSPSGNLISANRISQFGNNRYLLFGACETPSGLYFVGEHKPNFSSASNSFFMRASLSGSMIWAKENSQLPVMLAVTPSPDGDIVAMGQDNAEIALIKFNSSGAVTWTHYYELPGGRLQTTRMITNQNGDFILSGAFKSNSSIYAYPMIARVDTNAFLWGAWFSQDFLLEQGITNKSFLEQSRAGEYLWAFEKYFLQIAPNLDFCGRSSLLSLIQTQAYTRTLSNITPLGTANNAGQIFSVDFKPYTMALSEMDFCHSTACSNDDSREIIADINGSMCQGYSLRFFADPDFTSQIRQWYLDGTPLGTTSTQDISFPTPGIHRVTADYEVGPGCIKQVGMDVRVDSCDVPQIPLAKVDLELPTGRFADLQAYPGGGFVAIHREAGNGMDSAYVVRLDAQYGIVWSRRVAYAGNYGQYLYNLCPLPDGRIVLVGIVPSNPEAILYFITLDANGNSLQTRAWTTGNAFYEVRDVLALDSTAIFICANSGNTGSDDPFLAKFDQNGQALWQKTYQVQFNGNTASSEVQRMEFDNNGDLWMGFSHGQIAKFDTAGNILLWREISGSPGTGPSTTIREFTSIEVNQDGDINFIGSFTGVPSRNLIFQVSPQAQPRFLKSLPAGLSIYVSEQGFNDDLLIGLTHSTNGRMTVYSTDKWGNPLYFNYSESNIGSSFNPLWTPGGLVYTPGQGYCLATGPTIESLGYDLQSCNRNPQVFTTETGRIDIDTISSSIVTPRPLVPANPGTLPVFSAARTDTLICAACPPLANFTLSNSNPCAGAAITLNPDNTGAPAYQWYQNGQLISTAVQPSISFPSPGTYILELRVPGVCADTTVQSITVGGVSFAVSPDTSICQGSSTQLSVSGGQTFSWSPASGLSSSTVSSPTAQPTVTTDYIVTVGDGQGCFGTDTIRVTVFDLPIAQAGVDTSICTGGQVSLLASAAGGSPAYTYAWSNGPQTASNSVSPINTTQYTVTVSDANSCQGSDQVTVTVHPLPIVNAGPNQNLCLGEILNLQAFAAGGSSPYSYEWSTGDTTATLNLLPTSSGSYFVTLTDANQCTAQDTVEVTLHPQPTANFSFLVNNGTTYDFTDLSSGNPVTWFWEFGDGNSSNQQNPQHTFAVVDTYTVCLQITDANGCRDTLCRILPPDPTSVAPHQVGNWQIRPNPASENLNIRAQFMGAEDFQLRLYDGRGKILKSQSFTGIQQMQTDWDLSNYAEGIYLLQAEGPDLQHTQKVIIQR